jgi:uncharacterized membrane protein
VTPETGDTNTVFTFEVTYKYEKNVKPLAIKVVIDGKSYNMTQKDAADTNYTDGAIYQFSTSLPAGNYTYYFRCSVGLLSIRVPALGSEPTLVVTEAPPPEEKPAEEEESILGLGKTAGLDNAVIIMIVVVIIVVVIVFFMFWRRREREYVPSEEYYAPPEPAKGKITAEMLERRLIEGAISEETYKKLKRKYGLEEEEQYEEFLDIGKEERAEPPSTKRKFCSHCGKGIAPDALFCSYCGAQQQQTAAPLPPVTPTPVQTPSPPAPREETGVEESKAHTATSECVFCGKPAEPGEDVCKACSDEFAV